jgi:thioredoxin-like negative regulator of GroEL
MSSKLRWSLGLGSVGLAILLWLGVTAWRASVMEGQRERAVQKVESLISESRWLEARGALRAFWSNFGRDLTPTEAQSWRRMDFQISEESGDLARLVWLQQQAPEIAREMESVGLLLVRTFAAAGQSEEAVRLREDWKGREEQSHLWMALDVDLHLAKGQREEALALLRSQEFSGKEDVGRRLRLSFLSAKPGEAWGELTAALQADPSNPDVRSFRGQLLERAGAVQDARIEFVAALVAVPEDPVRRDQLAEFYRRHDSSAAAL